VQAADELKVEFDLAVPLSSPQGMCLQQHSTSCKRSGPASSPEHYIRLEVVPSSYTFFSMVHWLLTAAMKHINTDTNLLIPQLLHQTDHLLPAGMSDRNMQQPNSQLH
jgi:hypothetical protein